MVAKVVVERVVAVTAATGKEVEEMVVVAMALVARVVVVTVVVDRAVAETAAVATVVVRVEEGLVGVDRAGVKALAVMPAVARSGVLMEVARARPPCGCASTTLP